MLLDIALKHPAIHVRTTARLTTETIHTVLPEFRPLPQDEWTSLGSLTDSVYEPGQWVPLPNARGAFDSHLGGSAGFDAWAVRALTINPTEAYHTHNTTAKVCRLVGIHAPRRTHDICVDLGEISIDFCCSTSKFDEVYVSYGVLKGLTWPRLEGSRTVHADLCGIRPRILPVVYRRWHLVYRNAHSVLVQVCVLPTFAVLVSSDYSPADT